MKKTVLLLTIVCAGQLFGMYEGQKPSDDNKPQYGHYIGMENLPKEIQGLVIAYINTYKKLDNIIKAIKATGLANKALYKIVEEQYGNQKGFAALMHMLANRFDVTTESIAEKFNTPAAKVYLDLANQLNDAISIFDFDQALKLIQQGADVNYPAELVIKILSSTKDIDEIINALEEASKTNRALHKVIYEEYGDLKGSNALAEALKYVINPVDFWAKWDLPGIVASYLLGNRLKGALEDNNIEKVKELIKQGVNVNYNYGTKTWEVDRRFQEGQFVYDTISYDNVTPFDMAVILGHVEIAKLLLDAGATIQPYDYYEEHGLMYTPHKLVEKGSSSSPDVYSEWRNYKYKEEVDIEQELENRAKIKEMIEEVTKKWKK